MSALPASADHSRVVSVPGVGSPSGPAFSIGWWKYASVHWLAGVLARSACSFATSLLIRAGPIWRFEFNAIRCQPATSTVDMSSAPAPQYPRYPTGSGPSSASYSWLPITGLVIDLNRSNHWWVAWPYQL